MIEFSVDAADQKTYGKFEEDSMGGLTSKRQAMVEIRNELKSSTKIIASGVNQVDVDMRLWPDSGRTSSITFRNGST